VANKGPYVYSQTKVPLGDGGDQRQHEMRRGRGYKNLCYLLLKAHLIAATRSEFVAFRAKRPKMPLPSDSCAEPLRRVGSGETAIITALLRDRQNAGATARAQTSER